MKKAWSIAAAAALALVAGTTAQVDIDREGTGARRAELDQMELKPFTGNWTALEGWMNGTVAPADMQGKVVLLTTWSTWYRGSHSALSIAQQLHEKYGDQGLVVVGVHHERKFEGADKVAESKGVTFPVAHDASGSFRTALNVDQDPDFYLIDRAGNLRYADVKTSAVEKAVEALVAETAEEAAAVPTNVLAAAREAEQDKYRSREIKDGLRPGQTLNVPFVMPDASAFESAAWPEHNTQSLSAQDFQGKPMPASFGNETYLTKRPVTDGRVVVIDFWATWCGPCKRAMPGLDTLQKDHKKDLVIIGISDEPESKVRSFMASNHYTFTKAIDQAKTLNNAFQVRGIPHTVILSTDGTIRWQGNPLDPNFKKALEKVLAVDPGVKARQAAERAYLASLQGE